MPTSLKPQNNLHTFDPRLRKLLELGTKTRIIIQGDRTKNEKQEYDRLIHLSQRLNTLRSNLREVDGDSANHLYRAIVRLDRPNLTLTVEPRDSSFNDLLDQFEKGAKVESLIINSDASAELDDLASTLGEALRTPTNE